VVDLTRQAIDDVEIEARPYSYGPPQDRVRRVLALISPAGSASGR
jgi:hypothetical protein